ncbi:hypothetical protein QEH59_09640 [Coraliomargarita sp. SDUM461004]|uniref:Anchor protein n=1 Tax=Thalassobacterium sedimentorum TaxID=3041258 RepID=A0ABU1AKI5_9BACT|nr:hypothetical protein [Coraliomargarita sp. SDUM461004]MDQ8194688.1 hypothetical protein [Coraliomargarita sp. SDUM461004]
MKKLLCSVTIILTATLTLTQANVTFDFNDQTAFDSNFPVGSGNNENDSNRWLYGDESSVSLSGGSLHLHAGSSTDNPSSSSVTIYSNVAYSSNFDFISEAKVVRFEGLTMSVPSSGSTYVTNFGVANGHVGNLIKNSGPDDSIYIRMNRNGSAFELVQRIGGDSVSVENLNLGFDFSGGLGSVTFDYIEMTVSANAWALEAQISTGTLDGTTNISTSGTFDTAFESSSWGSDFHLAIQAEQAAENADRYTDLSLDSVSVSAIPEVSYASLIMGLLVVSLVGITRSKRV